MKRNIGIGMLLVLVAVFPLVAEQRITVEVEPGKHWYSRMWIFVIPVNKTPQLAVWVETMDGEYIDTLTVTGRTAEQNWRSAPDGGRPESLPVWTHASAVADIDGATSATPDGRVQLERDGSRYEPGKQYIVRAEINHSFDYNECWQKKAREGDPGYSGVNGQPSVVYEGLLTGEPGFRVDLKPVGQGSVDGRDGSCRRNLDGLTTALEIVDSITVLFVSE